MLYDIKNLCFSYGRHTVLNNLSLTMESGCFYGILGPNGCGKTTLLDLLVRHLQPESGSIHFNDKPLNVFSPAQLARQVALVAQTAAMNFPYTTGELVMMGRHPYIGRFSSPGPLDKKAVDTAMAHADVSDLRHQPVTELSGGERQRVFFARALAQETPVLILDEATSNLDIKHSLGLLSIVRQGMEKQGKTVIAVFHDINLAALFCDRLVVMKQGRMFATGQVKDILDAHLISDVYDVESQVTDNGFSNSRQVSFRPGGHL
ncbi:MAG: ABC transporter ATP-binding protein [Proteobacteria bacterium]|nr:ABC transporter ATP-binding protein [Pseudomonadota bacterium]